ncbi:MAG: DUF1993 domain-containing protein [bacterium]|nr:DUF1993 domain-containing protein [bacterium]
MNPTNLMYDASVPVFKQLLSSLNTILDKTQIHMNEHPAQSATLLQASLYPDMFHFIRQVQIATDFAKGVTARLAGLEVPVFDDLETNISELKKRIDKTLLFIATIKPEQINGSENKEIITRPGTPKEKRFNGKSYLLHYGIPQFFFHITTAYGILRSNGVEIGKKDYMGEY